MTVAMGGLARLRGPLELPGADLRDQELISARHFYCVVVAGWSHWDQTNPLSLSQIPDICNNTIK
eukprot:1979351-Ditylum_brightwellii.AAC.1